jgi:AmmeMemoRadiSam system protein A
MDALLNKEQGRELVLLARATLQHRLAGGGKLQPPADPALNRHQAAFVTLKKQGKLRGCIGNLEPVGPLWAGVRDNAINAGFNDFRFSPLQPEELSEVTVEVSVLTEPEVLDYIDAEDLLRKLRPGIDGVIISDGFRQATFLPQVWLQLPNTEDFLNHLCQKAGLARKSWRDKPLNIKVYQVQEFYEE